MKWERYEVYRSPKIVITNMFYIKLWVIFTDWIGVRTIQNIYNIQPCIPQPPAKKKTLHTGKSIKIMGKPISFVRGEIFDRILSKIQKLSHCLHTI